jgi:hypothetical protein
LTTLKEMIYSFLNEVKAVLKEYLRERETALKKRLQKLLTAGLIVGVLTALAILLIGSAALFLVIGSLKYLSTFMPAWEAWMIMGFVSAVVAALLFAVLFIFIRKQLKSPPTKQI